MQLAFFITEILFDVINKLWYDIIDIFSLFFCKGPFDIKVIWKQFGNGK